MTLADTAFTRCCYGNCEAIKRQYTHFISLGKVSEFYARSDCFPQKSFSTVLKDSFRRHYYHFLRNFLLFLQSQQKHSYVLMLKFNRLFLIYF